MDIYTEIRQRVKSYRNVVLEEDQYGLSVTPIGGFTVSIASNDEYCTVDFEGWHKHFDTSQEALDCFAWGLSENCRVKVFSRGGKAHKWTAQSLENGVWSDVSTTGLLFFPFWRKVEISYAQNKLELS